MAIDVCYVDPRCDFLGSAEWRVDRGRQEAYRSDVYLSFVAIRSYVHYWLGFYVVMTQKLQNYFCGASPPGCWRKRANDARDWEIALAGRFTDWSAKLVEAVHQGNPPEDVVIQAMRVNDIVLAAISVEAFFETQTQTHTV